MVKRAPRKRRPKKRWVQDVHTVSTFPPQNLFTKDAETIARTMATQRVSPKGIGSAIRMVQYFINRAGKALAAQQRNELERAKLLLQERLKAQHRPSAGRKTPTATDPRKKPSVGARPC